MKPKGNVPVCEKGAQIEANRPKVSFIISKVLEFFTFIDEQPAVIDDELLFRLNAYGQSVQILSNLLLTTETFQ